MGQFRVASVVHFFNSIASRRGQGDWTIFSLVLRYLSYMTFKERSIINSFEIVVSFWNCHAYSHIVRINVQILSFMMSIIWTLKTWNEFKAAFDRIKRYLIEVLKIKRNIKYFINVLIVALLKSGKCIKLSCRNKKRSILINFIISTLQFKV